MGKHHARNGYLDNGDNVYFQARAVTVVELLERAVREGRPLRLSWPEDQDDEPSERTDVLHLLNNWDL
jgi:hypothetical protein